MKTLNKTKMEALKITMNTMSRGVLIIVIALTTFTSLTSCGHTKTAQGASTGAIVGGLVGGWEGAATGALVGGGVGLMADSADDKVVRQQQKEREIAELKRSNAAKEPKPVAKVQSSHVLKGTTWKLVSMVDENKTSETITSFILTFRSDSKATTIIVKKDGTTEAYTESYTLVGDALIFKGKDYVVNSEFKISGEQLVVVTPTHRVVFEEIQEEV